MNDSREGMEPPALPFGRSATALSLIHWWRRSIVGQIDHERIVARILEESGWSARYAFMSMMSAGIAVLGLLLASPAVVIGAMLISPLMSPILGFGFSLALFDFKEMRRSITALVFGAITAVLFTALIVVASPLKTATAEILARTRPNLFDLLVALFAALAGSFAIIRGRGETIVGVAIATALMPPLAVVGYGLATWNLPVFSGAAALFITNFMTIALAATVMARLYGFGHRLSSQQSWTQTIILVVVFVAMSIPLAISLSRIAREALTVNAVRAYLADRFGPQARVTQLDVEFDRAPIAVRAVVIAPRSRAVGSPQLAAGLEKTLGRPLTLQVDQVLLNAGSKPLDAQRAELEQAKDAARTTETRDKVARLVALAAGISPDDVTVDPEAQRASATAAPLPGATLDTYHALELRISRSQSGWQITVTPPLGPLPVVHFDDGVDAPDDAARRAILLSCWAAQRWNVTRIGVPGLPAGPVAPHPLLAQRRALQIAAILRSQGLVVAPLPEAGQDFRLTPLPPASNP